MGNNPAQAREVKGDGCQVKGQPLVSESKQSEIKHLLVHEGCEYVEDVFLLSCFHELSMSRKVIAAPL